MHFVVTRAVGTHVVGTDKVDGQKKKIQRHKEERGWRSRTRESVFVSGNETR